MSKTHLKIKIKSLAAEASMIRLEERKLKRSYPPRKVVEHDPESNARRHRYITRTEAEIRRMKAAGFRIAVLRAHRTKEVRREARAAQLAYAFIRGRAYRESELNLWRRNDPSFPNDLCTRVAEIALRFGGFDISVRCMQTDKRRLASFAVIKEWMEGQEPAAVKAA